MYTPNELEALSMAFDGQMKRLQQDVMSDIIRRIAINGEVTRSADWQINRLYEIGVTKEHIEKSIQKSMNITDEEIEAMFKQVIESGYVRNEGIYKRLGAEFVPFEENELLQQYISAIAKQTAEEMHNISQSLGFAVKNADGTLTFKPIAEYYQDTLDNAINGIASGVFDYNTALKKAVKEMTNSGLRTVDYASGWSNRVDVAARRAIMTGMTQLTGKVNEMNAEQLGTDTYETTWHSGARPSHQVWQGRWYTMDELISVCGLGTVTGLNGANCYHDYYPVIPGISVPTYTAEELEEMNRKENTPVKYGDKEYTKYEALQRQRKLETTMRAQRQKIKLLQTGNADEDDIIAARCRYRGTSQEYTRFSEAMDLPQQRERVTIDGLGNIGQGKWKVDKKGESGIIDDKKGFRKKKLSQSIEEDLKNTNPNFSKGGDYQQNCGYCTVAYEMRRRGYDVVANSVNTIYVSEWKAMFENFKPLRPFAKRKNEIAQKISNIATSWGDGARGSIFVQWDGRKVGHFFSFEVVGDDVRFVDAQNGKNDVLYYFEYVKPSSVMFGRVDNLKMTDEAKKACKNRGG